MLKKWIYLVLLMCFWLSVKAQTPGSNATAQITMFRSRPLGQNSNTVMFTNFTTPFLPGDAVVTAIYPVAVMNAHYDSAGHNAFYGTGIDINTTFCVDDTTLDYGLPNGPSHPDVPSTQYHGPSLGTSLSILSTQEAVFSLCQSLFLDGITDTLNETSVGYAVYYTSSIPKISPLVTPPVTVPPGTGVAWSVPTSYSIGPSPGSTGTSTATLGQYLSLYGLTGTFQNPDGSLLNGWLRIRLQAAGTPLKNICLVPYQIIPTLNVSYKIVNGVPVGASNSQFTSTDCISPRFPYYIEVSDTNQQLIYSDNWYFPRPNTTYIDIGKMATENFSGPINVAIPTGIIGNPIQNQVITQPVGTSLTINGTVIFNGTVSYANPITFSTISTTSISVNGAAGSYPVDVIGLINTSQGFAIAGNVGTNGQFLMSQGVGQPDIWSTIPSFPTMHYQTIASNGSVQTQRDRTNFSSNFTTTDSASPSQTTIDLVNVGTAGSCANPASINLDAFGRITACTPGSAPATGSDQYISFNGPAISGSGGSNNISSVTTTATFAPAQADTSYILSGCMVFNTTGATDFITAIAIISPSSFTYKMQQVQNNGGNSLGGSTVVKCHLHHN